MVTMLVVVGHAKSPGRPNRPSAAGSLPITGAITKMSVAMKTTTSSVSGDKNQAISGSVTTTIISASIAYMSAPM